MVSVLWGNDTSKSDVEEHTARDVLLVLFSSSVWENAEGFIWYKLTGSECE